MRPPRRNACGASAPSPLGVTRSCQSRGLASSSSCRVPNAPAKNPSVPPSPRGLEIGLWRGRLAGTCHPAHVEREVLLTIKKPLRARVPAYDGGVLEERVFEGWAMYTMGCWPVWSSSGPRALRLKIFIARKVVCCPSIVPLEQQ
jgi:hypothetical protein